MPFRADVDDGRSRPPRTIGRYAIYGEIAAGGMATVHFGRLVGAVGFTRPVAIKRLHARFAKDPEFRAGLIEEARMVARIRHQNVVPTLDVVADEDELFLVLEYVQGESLWRLMKAAHDRRVRVPPHIGITIVSHLLHGLHAAHEAKSETGAPLGIVHRDVSPQNVLVGTDGAARVLDFGVARALVDLRDTPPRDPASRARDSARKEKVQGKLAYMAPEQLTGENVTRQADVFATGVVLWELLAGRRLFHRANPETLILEKLSGAPIPPPTAMNERAPKVLDAIVLKALAHVPANRYATAREMAVALEACGKLATLSEVGEWVERMAHDALGMRARQIAECESLSLTAAKEIPTPGSPSMSPLVASIGPPGLPAPPPLPSPTAPEEGSAAHSAETTAFPRDRMRRSLASLLEPDLDARVLARLRQFSSRLDQAARRAGSLRGRGRIMGTAAFASALLLASVATVRAIAARWDSSPVDARSVAFRGPKRLAAPLGVCPEGMAAVPGGGFSMGSDDDLPAERPAHPVTLSPYCIDTFEVTTDDYRACVDRGDCRRASATNEWIGVSALDHRAFDSLCNIRDASRGRHPINCVDWTMASQYCAARDARLPTEAEWEFAARGSEGRRYPWGDDAPSPRFLNACGKECVDWGKRNHIDEAAMYQGADGWPTTAPIGSFPDGQSKYGVQDLVGNVWEWVSDYFGSYDPGVHDDPRGPPSGRERVIRGGAWNGAYADWMRTTFRYHDPPETKSYGIRLPLRVGAIPSRSLREGHARALTRASFAVSRLLTAFTG